MKIGIIGRPKVGKTTLFRLLTQPKGDSPMKGSLPSVGIMEVPDPRVAWLSTVFQPKRTIFARIDIEDVQPYTGRELLNSTRNFEAVVIVLGAFMSINADELMTMLDDFEMECYVSDLASVEGRLERLKSNKARPVSPMEVPFLEKCKDALDKEIPLRAVDFEDHEKDFVSNFAFLTRKPVIVAVNVSEESLQSGTYPGKDVLESYCAKREYPIVIFSGEVEEEIADLPEEDRLTFLKEYGLKEPGTVRIARVSYEHLGLISFFTVGSDEVRAWTITKGMNAKEAAGRIHSDLEKGFIRAEVVAYQDFREAGSMKVCKEKGILRLEGKDYIVKDGDIMNIRFNV
jgi:GTP-binding protein YchF